MRYLIINIIDAVKQGMFDAIAHQTNCMHRWNTGLAPQIKSAFPQAYASDLLTLFGDKEKLGTCSFSIVSTQHRQAPILIANCYGQYQNCSNGGTTDYDYLRSALQQLSTSLPPGSHIGLPKIGCGAAKGDWEIVSKIIAEVFASHHVTICVLNSKDIPADANL